LRAITIPAFYFEKRFDGLYDALDGKQRSNAISQYINGNYSLCDDFEIVTDDEGKEHDFSCLYFYSLPDWAQEAIKEFSLTIYYFEDLTEEQRDNIFYRLNNGKPLTAVELTRVKAKSLTQFQEMAKHEIVNLAVSDKGRIKYNHENLTMQAWAVCFTDDVSFETKVFRNLIEKVEVEQKQVEAVYRRFNTILDIHNSYGEGKTEKRLQKRIITRTHLVSLTKAAHIAEARGYDTQKFKTWAMYFFSGTKGASIDETYNFASGAGSARKDKVSARIDAIINSMTEYFKGEEVA